MNFAPANKANIKKAAGIIKKGGIVAFPTETVYGLGADALNPIAVSRIFEVKRRPFFDPIIVHIASLSGIEKLVTSFGGMAKSLAERFWPGPLTLVLPKSNNVPDIVTAGLATVAIRMPANKIAMDLITEAGVPIAAPSANPFGFISPTTAWHVKEHLSDVDMILDGGKCELGIESTIIKIENSYPLVMRHGGLPLEEIENVTGKVSIAKSEGEGPVSPGQMPYHYSPKNPIVLISDITAQDIKGERAGLLSFKIPQSELPFERIEVLSPAGNMREAAANLFSSLHSLDAAGLDIIYAEIIDQKGLGIAIMDRLYRASTKRK